MKPRKDIRPFGIRLVWIQAILSCFLIGAFFESFGIGLALFGIVALILHYLFTQFAHPRIIAGHITFLWFCVTVLWGSWLDELAATTYITVILAILVVCISFWANTQLLQWPEIDRWFSNSQSKD